MRGVRPTGAEHDVIAERAGRYSRRRFLGVAGAALLSGCGAREAGKAPPGDAEVLSELLGHERATVAALAAPGAPAAARALRDQDRRHAARLARELAARGRPSVPAPAASGDPGGAEERIQQGVFAYVEALPRLADPELRVLMMQIAASEAEHLAALRLLAGEEPAPDAFAGFAP